MRETTFKTKVLCLLAAAAFLPAGCVGIQEYERTKEADRKELSALRGTLDAANAKIEELAGKVALLQGKVDSAKAAASPETAQPPGQAAEPIAAPLPPEGLTVIRLGEDAEHKAASAAAVAEAVKAEPRKKGAAPAAPPKVEQPKKAVDAPSAQAEAARGADIQPAALLTAVKAYNAGLESFNAGRFAEARGAFSGLVKAYPKHHLADNALYWIGESYYSENDFQKAADAFKEVFEKYPLGNKAPDAMLKASYTQARLKNDAMAKEYLDRLLKTYPASEAAATARGGKGEANPSKKGKD